MRTPTPTFEALAESTPTPVSLRLLAAHNLERAALEKAKSQLRRGLPPAAVAAHLRHADRRIRGISASWSGTIYQGRAAVPGFVR